MEMPNIRHSIWAKSAKVYAMLSISNTKSINAGHEIILVNINFEFELSHCTIFKKCLQYFELTSAKRFVVLSVKIIFASVISTTYSIKVAN